MTENETLHGCLSKSLLAFLKMSNEEKKSKYGRNVAKYYERVVKAINSSFNDHKLALSLLPPEYRSKISFMPKYVEMLSYHIENEWIKEAPEQVITHTIQNLKALSNQFENSPLEQLASKDFDKMLDWLEYLKSNSITVQSKPERKHRDSNPLF